jgi:thymidylate synthase (FAD)
MLEHVSIAVRVICDRAIANEIVRHRMASYAQESTRYVNYGKEKFGKEITVIKPCFFTNYCEDDCKHNACINCSLERKELIRYSIWRNAMQEAEDAYFELLDAGCSPQEARTVLPNSLKTEIVMTLNLRSWINFFKLRTAKDAHPQMREVANMILDEFKKEIPLIFDKINPYKGE